ncbi:MAG: asparaginase [Schumannella sp.]|nr:asparaginase [Schumannella sp.]
MNYLDAAGSVELAVVERGGIPESRHLGAAVLVDADGRVLDALGDPAALIFPRSAVKPLQATAVLSTGLALVGEELALAAASHAGTPAHVAVVQRMLASAGLDESALQCPADWPLDSAARTRASERRRITMNCSGKHASFLAAAVHNGWPVAQYLAPEHPVQRAVATTVADFAGEAVAAWGIDGCNAPTPVISLTGLARSFSRVAMSDSGLADAMRAHPWAVDGPGRENAVTIAETGLLAKLGAEGVLVLATASGQAVAIKTLDGANRARTAVGLELLVRAGLLARERADAVLAVVGEPGLRVTF